MKRRQLGVLAALVALAGCGLFVLSSPQRMRDWVGLRPAVQLHTELGLLWDRSPSQRTLLLTGDSRLQELSGPLLEQSAWREVNVAQGGSTAGQWAQALEDRKPRAVNDTYDVAILWVGINDFLNHASAMEATAEHIVTAARRLRGYAKRVIVLEQIPLRMPWDIEASRLLSEKVARLNPVLRARLSAEQGIELATIHDALRAPDGLLVPWFARDGLHLSDEGRRWLRRHIASLVR